MRRGGLPAQWHGCGWRVVARMRVGRIANPSDRCRRSVRPHVVASKRPTPVTARRSAPSARSGPSPKNPLARSAHAEMDAIVPSVSCLAHCVVQPLLGVIIRAARQGIIDRRRPAFLLKHGQDAPLARASCRYRFTSALLIRQLVRVGVPVRKKIARCPPARCPRLPIGPPSLPTRCEAPRHPRPTVDSRDA